MGCRLPPFTEPEFCRHLVAQSPVALAAEVQAALFQHYVELCRWNPRISLVGPGTAEQILERHYGESLAALPFLRAADKVVLDVGSGAGFPGWVLAAARPDLEVTLVEPQERKRAFLQAASRRAGLSCNYLGARVGPGRGSPGRGSPGLPAEFPPAIDMVTSRALKLPPSFFEQLAAHSPQIRFLLWQGAQNPDLPAGGQVIHEVPLAGSQRRRILEIILV